MASRKRQTIKMKPIIYVLSVFDLDGECKFIKNKTTELLKMFLAATLVEINRRLGIKKGDRRQCIVLSISLLAPCECM